MTRVGAAVLAGLALALAGCGGDGGTSSGAKSMIMATTTSTRDSGLLDVLVPDFRRASACQVKTVAVGSGQALALGARGDADVLLVHSPKAEEQYMAAGNGGTRRAVMYNDFVLVGPPSDPAGIRGASGAVAALKRIARAKAPFASRADDSGTNAKELALWKRAGIAPKGSWYIQTGQGMGETLTIADQKQAYTLTDRGTFLATQGLRAKILTQGDPDLRNQYHVITVRAPGVNAACARRFSDWITSAPTQKEIGRFGVRRYGQPLFFPNAKG